MAKPHGSVRIGPISLFALIIILCLSVLAVLSLTAARAELSTTQRQADTTTETYQLETVGQAFVAEVDGALAPLRERGDVTSQEISAALAPALAAYGVAVQAPAPQAASGAEDVGEVIGDDGAAPSEAASADAVGEVIEDAAAAPSASASEVIEDDAAVSSESSSAVVAIECPAGDFSDTVTATGSFGDGTLSVTFSMPSGRTLNVVMGIGGDATYTLEQWKVTTQWIDDGTGENLWLG